MKSGPWMRCIAWNSMPAPNCRARRCRRGSGGASPWPGCCWLFVFCGFWLCFFLFLLFFLCCCCCRCWANTSTGAGWWCSPPTRRWRSPPAAHGMCTSASERRGHVVGLEVCGDARLDAGDAAARGCAHHLVFLRDRGEPVSPRDRAGDDYPAPHGAGGGVGGGAARVDVVAGQVVLRRLHGR